MSSFVFEFSGGREFVNEDRVTVLDAFIAVSWWFCSRYGALYSRH